MKRAAITFSLFIILIVVLADMGRLPGFVNYLIHDLPYGDKIGHFVLFGLMNFFITRATLSAFSNRSPVRVAVSSGLILALFIAAEEYSQRYFSSRTSDWIDLFASLAGVILGGLVAFKRRAAG